MSFESAKSKSVKEIIQSETSSRDLWAETAFMKLVDAKVGEEVSRHILVLCSAVGDLKANLHSVVDKIISSNERLAKSNERYSRALCWLTGGLVLVGLLQVIVFFTHQGK